jgi:anaerobic selenocysteine-containing dehydrogenase
MKPKDKRHSSDFDIKDFNRRALIKAGFAGLIPLIFGGCTHSEKEKPVRMAQTYVPPQDRITYKVNGDGWIEPPEGCVPSACWQCVCRCSNWVFTKDDRITHIEGNPNSQRTRGHLCVKGLGGVDQVYNPDRVLFPMKRIKGTPRGGGQWERISWEETLKILASRIKKNLDKDKPEKIMFHYGRMKASHSTIIKKTFLKALGTKTIGNHTSICESAKWTAQELTWGKHYDVNDVTNTNFILNFGSNVLEAHTSHNVFSQRIGDALANGVKMYTFDVRLSNTAAKSTEWIPVKPGTDLAVILAMANVVIEEGLYDASFINKWTNVTIKTLKDHLSEYTPEWAESISGVNAGKIHSLAIEYAKAKPGTIISYRGIVAHYNGVEAERAVMMLEALCGYIDTRGGRCKAIGAKWKNSFKLPHYAKKQKKLNILDGQDILFPTHHVSHQILKMIKEGKHGRPDIYMTYCYNPVYVNGNCGENIEILKDEHLIPFSVSINCYYDESASLADLILPDATYLERWSWEDMVSYDQIPEYYIRQPAIQPLAEARDFADVCCELAKMVERPLPFNSHEEFVKDACENTPSVKKAGGFEFMKRYAVWHDKEAAPIYQSYTKMIKPEDLSGTVVDKKTRVIWNGKPEEDYTTTKDAYKLYVGQMIDGIAYKGFKPDKINKSGRFEIYSHFLENKGSNPLPTWVPIPEHRNLGEKELILVTYKVVVQTISRTQNCKYLTEIYHDNPALINPVTASFLGISNGDKIEVLSDIGKIMTTAKITEGIVPGIIAISTHCGHWEYGRFASNKKSPFGRYDDPDLDNIWWEDKRGVHPNWIIPNLPEPIAGAQRWLDTVVKVKRVT